MAAPARPPTALHVQLPPDLPEDGAQAGRCLVDLHSLRDEWQLMHNRKLSPEQARPSPAMLVVLWWWLCWVVVGRLSP